MSSDHRFTRAQKAVLLGFSGLLVLTAVLLLAWPRAQRISTNSLQAPEAVATLEPGAAPVCIAGLNVPAAAGGVELRVHSAGAGARLVATLEVAGRKVGTGVEDADRPGKAQVLLDGDAGRDGPGRDNTGRDNTGRVCLRALDAGVQIGGWPDAAARPELLTQAGRPLPGDAHLAFLRQQKRPALAMVGDVFARAALFKPAWVGAWTFYLALLLALGVAGCGLAALLREPAGHDVGGDGAALKLRRWLVIVGLVTFANGLVWTLMAPAFQVPDEGAHYSYVDTLAQRGLPAHTAGEGPGQYSQRLTLALKYTADSLVGLSDVRPPWDAAQERAWRAQDRALGASAEEATGISPAATYSPLYYAPATLAYRVGGRGPFDKLWAIRLYSLLLTVGSALLVFLTARELLPGWRLAAPVAGLAAAFQPMFLHIGTGVQIDAMLVLVATGVAYLLARAWRRGLQTGLAVAIGALFAFGYHVKPTMIGLLPALVLAAALYVATGPGLRSDRLKRLAAGSAALAVVGIAGYLAFETGATTSEALVDAASPKSPSVTGLASYTWQYFLPPLPGMYEWFNFPPPVITGLLRGFFANFGHLDTYFPEWFYALIGFAVLAILVGVARLARLERARWRIWGGPAAVAVTAVVGVTVFIVFTGYLIAVGSGTRFVQGRYLLPCIAVFGLTVALACQGYGERWARTVAVLSIGALAALNLFSLGLVLSRYYM